MLNFDPFWDKKGFKSLKILLNFFTYCNIYFAIFGYILFHKIVFKISKSCFLSWFLHHLLMMKIEDPID